MNQPAKRITLMQAGKMKRKLILSEPPYPAIGQQFEITDEPGLWMVVGIEDTTVIATIPFPPKPPEAA